jgi:hypothetical protein
MKENEVFFVSKEYASKIKAKDFYDDTTPLEYLNVVKEIKFLESEVYIILSNFNYSLSRQYTLSEIYINDNCFKFNETLQFNIKKYRRLKDHDQELILSIDQEKFWKALEDEY